LGAGSAVGEQQQRERETVSGDADSRSKKGTGAVTPGAVKSALTRFFNRTSKESDPYVIDLGDLAEGRPRLEPGVNGEVIPVFDDQPSTIIAYSLSSSEYESQFRQFSRSDPTKDTDDRKDLERRMLQRDKTHVKHNFRDVDDKGQTVVKFVCTTYWATQFHSVRCAFLTSNEVNNGQSDISINDEKCFVRSLATAYSWATSGGKSGASFAKSADGRFVVKMISRTELQMFLDCAPAYFEYLSKAFFHGLPTVLCKILGVYQLGYHNRVTGKRSMEQVVVMPNIFHGRKISKIFDLKGSLRGRYANVNADKEESATADADGTSKSASNRSKSEKDPKGNKEVYDDVGSDSEESSDSENTDDSTLSSPKEERPNVATLLDGDFLEFTVGRPLPLSDRAKAVFHMSILNDTLFLSIINVLDYSILVGIDEDRMELVVGIIDFMRQYDIIKQMERVGKSVTMVVGSEAPTVIQPPLYKARFTNAMERYFMTVPSKWTTI